MKGGGTVQSLSSLTEVQRVFVGMMVDVIAEGCFCYTQNILRDNGLTCTSVNVLEMSGTKSMGARVTSGTTRISCAWQA